MRAAKRPAQARGASLGMELLERRNLLSAASAVADSPLTERLRITEVNYHPLDPSAAEIAAGFADADEFEYIELRNISEQDLSLAGAQFSNGIAFSLSNLTLSPQEHLLVVKNPAAFRFRYGNESRIDGPYDGVLSNSGETLQLIDAALGDIHNFTYDDSGLWPLVADGNGASLEVLDPGGDYDDPANWRPSAEYLGSPGRVGKAADTRVVINELLANPDGLQDDYIELYNSTFQSIDLGGWYLSDSAIEPRKFRIPNGTVIAPNGYLAFDSTDINPGDGANSSDFQLSAAGESVGLFSADAANNIDLIIDFVEFGGTRPSQTLGRLPDGLGDLFPMVAGSAGGVNSGPQVPDVLLSEIFYNSDEPAGADSLEFVELYNRTGATIDLAGWQLLGGIEFVFPPQTLLPANSATIVVGFDPVNEPNSAQQAAAFRTKYGLAATVSLQGAYSGGLSNDREYIELRRPGAAPSEDPDFIPDQLEDRVIYSDLLPWPAAADGEGDSLKRVAANRFGDLAPSWRASVPSPGSYREDPATFQVLEVRPNDFGFSLDFDRQLDVSVLNHYSGLGGAAADDLNISGLASGRITGSVFWDSQSRRLEWIKTGAPLPPDTYTVTLAGRSNGVRSAAGEALDGDGDSVAGGDFITQFEVASTTARSLSIADFAAASGETIDVRASGGIPIRIDNAADVTEFNLEIQYDPAMLSISNAIFSPDFPLGWEIDRIDLITPGLVDIGISGPTPLPAGPRDLFVLAATVPNGATVGAGQILGWQQAELNDGAITAVGDPGVQVVGMPGDASANREHSSYDAALIARVAMGVDSGFAAFPQFDPAIVGGIASAGNPLELADALAVARLALGLEVSPLPSPPPLLVNKTAELVFQPEFARLIWTDTFSPTPTPLAAVSTQRISDQRGLSQWAATALDATENEKFGPLDASMSEKPPKTIQGSVEPAGEDKPNLSETPADGRIRLVF